MGEAERSMYGGRKWGCGEGERKGRLRRWRTWRRIEMEVTVGILIVREGNGDVEGLERRADGGGRESAYGGREERWIKAKKDPRTYDLTIVEKNK